MKKRLFILFLFVFSLLFAEGNIFVNQIGYFPRAVKIAVVTCDADSFYVVSNASGKIVFRGKLSSPQYWAASGENVKLADFTALNIGGNYKIVAENVESYPFEISSGVWNEISEAALKAYYYQRASVALPEKYAGKWARTLGLPDTAVFVHSSAASDERPEGTVISAPGGWFDAGDYNKYTVSASVTAYTLTLLYEFFPDEFGNVSVKIPESGNNLPDILDEILWNARWMMKMQDPSDGGVYHKLTCREFQPYVMPAEVHAKRFVVGKSTVAALDFAAALSHLSVALKNHNPELKELADSCLIMAKAAWNWAKKNPNVHFRNPPDIYTGEYSDETLTDNFFWAGVELYFATRDTAYLCNLDKLDEMETDSLYWARVANLGILTVMNGEPAVRNKIPNANEMENVFRSAVDRIYNENKKSPYVISLDVFKWGSNANLLNQTLMLLAAYEFYGEQKYLDAAITNTDYVLGKNPVNICYVTGFGSVSPHNIHHRISIADGIKEPVPGLLVGGANPYYLIDCGKEKYPSLLPAKCYLDDVESYSTNEVAINWNAPLVFSLFAIDFFLEKKELSFNKN